MKGKLQMPHMTPARLFTIIGAGVALFLIVNLGQGWLICQSALRERNEKLQIVQAERARRDALMQQAAQAQTPANMARAIREELGWGPRGEGSAVLEFEGWPADETPATIQMYSEAHAPPHWLDWLSAFLLP